MEQIKVGTLIDDMGKIGMVRKIIGAGALAHLHPVVKWRMNYEIYYSDGVVGYLGIDSLQRLVDVGSIKVIFVPEDS